jgi:hypothetical protein
MTFVDSRPVGTPPVTSDLTPSLIRILLVDNDELVRVMLKIDLQRHLDLKIVGVAVNGQQAVDLASTLQPDAISKSFQACRLWPIPLWVIPNLK